LKAHFGRPQTQSEPKSADGHDEPRAAIAMLDLPCANFGVA
jgi:hypothetical protein